MSSHITLFWFRQDLRITDNPGLYAAAKRGVVLPIYILDDANAGEFKMGAASKWWLHYSLENLNESLEKKLNVYVGDPKKIISKIIQRNKIKAVYWNRAYEPWRIQSDSDIKSYLESMNIECQSFNASLLWEPWEILKSDKTPYKVYTPFYRNCLQAVIPRKPFHKPKKLICLRDEKNNSILSDLKLLPNIPWDKQIKTTWKIGEKSASQRLLSFLTKGLNGYKENRNYPGKPNVSRLSPHLHFGEISPHQIWYKANQIPWTVDVEHFLSEIIWREFSYYLLYHFPDLPHKNFQAKFDQFPWKNNIKALKAWQTGMTGYPFVDAGMRELWQTGYMHNRVRMIVASFLVKNLMIHWHCGENWFWDCLLDADLANNSASWQWVAGSGVDAAPYFRIFNPITQGEKFDKEGDYTRHYVPELKKLPNKYLFKPWEAPPAILEQAGVILGSTYPKPIVDIPSTRIQALEAYKQIFC